jgi:hypothetical protein
MHRLSILVAIVPLVAAPAEPAPARTVRVALRPLQATGVDASMASLVQSAVCAEIGRVQDVEAVCPEDVAAVVEMARQSVAFGACASDDCMKKLEGISKADRSVTGELSKAGEALLLSLALWEGDGAKLVRKVAETIPADPAKVLDRAPGLVRKLFR